MKRYSIIALLLLVFAFQAFSQKKDTKVIQFHGYAITADSLIGIPSVQIRNRGRTAESDAYGFFGFDACEGDTVHFTSRDYLPIVYIIPIKLKSDQYSLVQPMTRVTDYLSPTYIFPTKDTIKLSGLYCPRAPKSELELANEKHERERILSGGKSYYDKSVPQNIINPGAWAQFIEDWKSGNFKKSSKAINSKK